MKQGIVDARIYCSHFRFVPAILAIAVLLAAAAPLAVAAGDDVKQMDENSRRVVKQAKKLTQTGNLEEAENLLRGSVEQNPQNTASRLELAYVLFKQKKLGEAANISFEIAKAEPKNSFALAILGSTLLNAGNLREAAALFIQSLTLNKKEALAWAGFGMLDFYENRIEESIDKLYTAGFYDADEPEFIFTLAQVLARDERYNEAADAYDRFLSLSPSIETNKRNLIRGLVNFLRYLNDQKTLYDLDGPARTSVKFELVKERPIIELRVNGKEKPLRFIVDTGSGISIISKTTASQLGIKPITRGGQSNTIGGLGQFEVVYGFLKSVQIGDIRVKNVPVYIRELNSSNEIDGHIGVSLISKFLATIDYENMTFSLIKREFADKVISENDKDISLLLRRTTSGFLSAEIQLDGVEGAWNFIVDTSAGMSVISDKFAELIEIGRYLREEKIRVVGAGGATIDGVQSFLLPRIIIGDSDDNSRERVTAISLNLDSINETSGFQQSGILGANFLKNFRLTFDFKDSKVIFTPLK